MYTYICVCVVCVCIMVLLFPSLRGVFKESLSLSLCVRACVFVCVRVCAMKMLCYCCVHQRECVFMFVVRYVVRML